LRSAEWSVVKKRIRRWGGREVGWDVYRLFDGTNRDVVSFGTTPRFVVILVVRTGDGVGLMKRPLKRLRHTAARVLTG